MNYYNFDTLEVSFLPDNDAVLHVRLNRPKKLNAMNDQFWDDMRSCFDHAARDNNVRCIVISANGRAFSAGLDIQEAFMSSPNASSGEKVDAARHGLRFIQNTKRLQDSLSSLEKCWKPVVAAVHGACIGGGIDLISACDIRFCSDDAKFCIKEAAIGIAADLGTLQRLPKIIGNHSIVRELALTARDMYADEAKELGLVSKVLPSREELLKHACHTAGLIAEHSPVAIASTKANLIYSRDHSVEDGLDYILTWNAGALRKFFYYNINLNLHTHTHTHHMCRLYFIFLTLSLLFSSIHHIYM